MSAALKKGELSAERIGTHRFHDEAQYPRHAPCRIEAVHAVTDVTGFGLIGHLMEVCRGSGRAPTYALQRAVARGRRGFRGAGLRDRRIDRNWASCEARWSSLPTLRSGTANSSPTRRRVEDCSLRVHPRPCLRCSIFFGRGLRARGGYRPVRARRPGHRHHLKRPGDSLPENGTVLPIGAPEQRSEACPFHTVSSMRACASARGMDAIGLEVAQLLAEALEQERHERSLAAGGHVGEGLRNFSVYAVP